MCCGKSSYELRLIPNLLSSLVVACLLEVAAYYSVGSSSHSSYCYDYTGYLFNPGLDSNYDSDSGFGTCSGGYYLYTALAVIGFADSHTVLALLSSISTDSP